MRSGVVGWIEKTETSVSGVGGVREEPTRFGGRRREGTWRSRDGCNEEPDRTKEEDERWTRSEEWVVPYFSSRESGS